MHTLSRQELIDAIHDNLRNLGLDQLDVVNLRVGEVMGPSEGYGVACRADAKPRTIDSDGRSASSASGLSGPQRLQPSTGFFGKDCDSRR
jgi:aryl-alcohol dehydrogenase-like predicted oxidoreductase